MVNVIWIFQWLLVGWLVGILGYIIGGFGVHALPKRYIENKWAYINNVANHYSKTAMKLLDRAVLVERGTKYDIYSSDHDPEKNTDEFKLDGETAHVSNDTGLLSTLHKVPFGLVAPPEESVASYVSPEVAEFGRIEGERKEQGKLRDENGNYNERVTLSERRPLVQLREYADRMITGDRSLYDLEETVDLYKQSQAMFGSSRTVDVMIGLLAYAVGAGVLYLILSQSGGGGGSAVDIPLMVGGVLW